MALVTASARVLAACVISLCSVVPLAAHMNGIGVAHAACSGDEHDYLGARQNITNIAGTQAKIAVNNIQYCGSTNMYYYEGITPGTGYSQAGGGVGAGIGGPHAFDEFI